MNVFLKIAEQFAALYIKNALVAWRNRRATAIRLLAPLLFLLLALLIDRALRADSSNDTVYANVPTPNAEPINAIPQCSEDVYIGNRACIELVYSPNNTLATALINNVTSRNPKPIKAMGFLDRISVNNFLLANPDYAIGAVHFVFDDPFAVNPQLQGFVIQTNTTIKSFKANTQDPNKFIQLPLQSAVHREIVRYKLSLNPATAPLASNLIWNIALKVFPHPTLATVSVLSQVLGPFVFASCMFAFVTQIATVVMEKEMGLRQAMRTMGLRDSAYWLSWASWEFTLAFFTGHIIAIIGLILQFDLFLKNNYGLLFFLFFLFQLAMSSIALMASTFMQRTQTAVYLGFLIFIIGWIMQTVVIFGVPYTPDYWTTSPLSILITVIFSAFPWDLLMKGFTDLGSATVNSDSPGIRWNERFSYCQNIQSADAQDLYASGSGYNARDTYVNFNCVFPLGEIFKVFIALWLGYLVLAIYLDNVLKNEFGLSRPIFYFLYPSYWFPSTAAPADALSHVLREDDKGPNEIMNKDEDVLAEESRMRQLLQHRTGTNNKEGELAGYVDARNAIEVFGLKKKFGGSEGCCGRSLVCCGVCDSCSCRAAPSFWPIKGSWLAIEQNQLFCLLGPNGAGKTTTINCLTGALPPTHGDALIYGQSIRSTGGMDKIRSQMGVCPQFDVLWPELSGLEHLMLYGRIKGCGWSKVQEEAQTLLEKVKLTYAGKQRSGAYSGGMKRRLSVAIALLGDPKVVYLDEPTTGMDPISRRYVWDIIQEAKVGRAIVLTTHSMEEADILGDRIAIMALGRLRCLGSSLRLKQRFGSGYQVSVSVQPGTGVVVEEDVIAQRAQKVEGLFKQQLSLDPYERGRVYTTYLVPRDREPDLIPFLSSLEKHSQDLGLTDIQLSLTSLEEVFLTIAKNAALEAAQSGGPSKRKKDLPFCLTCLKASLLVLTLPISIFGVCFWGRFIVGKEKDMGPMATLPDGRDVPVTPGQDHVQDEEGNYYQVVWGVDDSGHLVVQETRALAPGALPAPPAFASSGSAQYAGAVSYPAVNGKARVPMPGNVLMEVAVGNVYVMNPVDGSTYHITWGKDHQGQDAVVACVPAGVAPPGQYMTAQPGGVPPIGINTPVAPPVYNNNGGSAPQYGGPQMGSGERVSNGRLSARLPLPDLMVANPVADTTPTTSASNLPNYLPSSRSSRGNV